MMNTASSNFTSKTIMKRLLDGCSEITLISGDIAQLHTTYSYKNYPVELILNICLFVQGCNQNDEAAAIKIVDEYLGRLHYSDWFRPFISHFDNMMKFELSDYSEFQLCEEINCFLRARQFLDTNYSLYGIFGIKRPVNTIYLEGKIGPLNKLVYLVRKEMNNKQAKLAIRQRQKNCNKNFISCRKLVNGLFNVHSKLLVLPINFGFKPNPEILTRTYRPSDLRGTFHSKYYLENLKDLLAQFLRNKRHNKTLQSIEGYILKFEHSVKKGFHLNAIFFIDGDKHDKDGDFTTELTKYWHQLTNGNGCTYNCILTNDKYRNLGIGMIERSDINKRNNLIMHVVNYLCKSDQFFLFKPIKNFKKFQISQVPQRSNSAELSKIQFNYSDEQILAREEIQ